MNYVQEARKIITDYFTAMKPSEQLLKEAADELRQGHITEAYAKELTAHAANEKRTLRDSAWSQLEALLRKFALAAGLADAPNGDALQGGDYKLLADNFPMSAEEFAALCERNKNNPTMLRKAMEYGNKNGGLAPYAKKYYRSAHDRVQLFKTLVQRCGAVLDAEPTSPTRGDAYWNMITRDVEPWATL